MAEIFSTLRWTKKQKEEKIMLCHYVQSIADVLPWLFRHHKLSLLRLILGLAFFNCAFKKQFFFFFATHFGPSLIVFCFLLFFFFNNIPFSFFIIIIFLLSVTHLHKSKNYIF